MENVMRTKALTNIVDRPSPNQSERNGQSVQFIVLHYTAMKTAEAAIERLCDPASQVSSHYVVDEAGVIYRLVPEDKKAWHAGVSHWDGKTDLNVSSVGIEIANPGNVDFPRAQMDAVLALSLDIARRHKVRPFYVVGHSDIAPDRKQDPGELFDWQYLAANKLGVWPSPTAQDYKTSASWGDSQVSGALVRLGFRPGVDLTILLKAFQRHFQPEAFTSGQAGIADVETRARLACLVRRKAIGDGVRASVARKRSARA
jgi:N-acetylmuramoyl-L-alanine amidase